ncbi:hypothetical protein [Hydrogenimonas sp. SS33]|uniref:hypothetical protein n=1 Tax=Hydrogenimonas leucolamina TaxID=2954236 RepID=UPI00336BD4AB
MKPELKERLEKAKTSYSGEAENETADVAAALDRLLRDIEDNGLSNIMHLDPYFGEISMPLEGELALLQERYGEDFAFFTTLLKELQEEIESHFEITDLYEDEEFEQCAEDIEAIKAEYTALFQKEHAAAMEAFTEKVLSDLGV